MLWSLWIPLVVMLLIGLSFVVVPFIRYQNNTTKLAMSADWYRRREKELSQELAAGQYTEQEYQQALTELKLTAKGELSQAQLAQLQDADSQAQAEKTSSKAWTGVAAGLFLVGIIGFYAVNGLYQSYQHRHDTLASMPELSQRIIQGSDQEVTTK